MKLTDYETKVLNKLGQLIQKGKLSNNFIVENFQLLTDFGLKTIKKCAEDNNISPQAIYKSKKFHKIEGFTIIIDN